MTFNQDSPSIFEAILGEKDAEIRRLRAKLISATAWMMRLADQYDRVDIAIAAEALNSEEPTDTGGKLPASCKECGHYFYCHTKPVANAYGGVGCNKKLGISNDDPVALRDKILNSESLLDTIFGSEEVSSE